MADCAIILYLECLIGLIYHFLKLGQHDLNNRLTLNHFILNMHISLHVGGPLMIVKMGRLCAPPEKLWRICVIPLNASNYITI